MATTLNDVVVDAADPAALSRFWSALLGTAITGESPDEVDVAIAEGMDLVFVRVAEGKCCEDVTSDRGSRTLTGRSTLSR
jgi:Glyoxalase-like domain